MGLFTLLLGLPANWFYGLKAGPKGSSLENVSNVMIIGKMLKPGFLSVIQELFV